MNRLALTTLVALTTTLFAPAFATPARAQAPAGLTIPVTGFAPGVVFAGTFDVNRFVASDGGVALTGTIIGTVTDTAGNVTSVVRNVAVPVDIAQATCAILHLNLGPLDLDLLGLVVHLNEIVLTIDAQSGPGKLLGNLLCAVVGLLDSPGGLARLLNDILGILG
jgi:hypothetical protein